MKVKEFNELKKQVKKGNVEGLNQEVISSLTLKQAQTIEDIIMNTIPLNGDNDDLNDVLDDIVTHILNMVDTKKVDTKKVANTKPEKEKPEKPKKPEKEKPVKPEKKKLLDTIKVGDMVKFRVEGEEVEHDIKIIYISRYDVIAITKNEREVFKIRKIDFNSQIFKWEDRKGEEYNIIITI